MFVLFFLFWVMLNGRITVEITLFGAGPGAFSYGFKDPYSTGPSGKFDYPDTRHDHCRDEGWRIPDSLL